MATWKPPNPYGGFAPSTLPAPKAPAPAKPRTAKQVKVRTGASTQIKTQFGTVGTPQATYTTTGAGRQPDNRAGKLGAGATSTPSARRPASKAAALPSTAGKTNVPARTVTGPPANTAPVKPASAKVAKPQPKAPARKAAVATTAAQQPQQQLSPQQIAEQYVQQALAPLYTGAQTQADQQNTAIQQFTKALIQATQGEPAQTAGFYDQAIGQQTNLAQAAAQSLAAANPNAQNQALLQSIGAPAAQGQQLAQQNQNVFQGGGAVGLYTNGFLPTNQLQAQKLAAVGNAQALPTIEGLRGQQALSVALATQTAARQAIDAKAPTLEQQYLNSFTTAQQRQQQLNLEAQAAGLKVQNQTFTQGLDKAKLQLSVDQFNAKQTAATSKIDPAVSKGFRDGFAHTASGAVVYQGGKPMSFNANGTVSAKTPSASQISKLVDTWRNGQVKSVTTVPKNPDGTPQYTDAQGNPKSITQSVTAGTLKYGQAYSRLRAMGVTDTKARQYLNTAYPRGTQGRSWVTNQEQTALRKAGLPSKARVITTVNGPRGLLSSQQYRALKKAGVRVPGTLYAEGFLIAPVN